KMETFIKEDFKSVIDDTVKNSKGIETIILVSGKFYYDLVRERAARGLDSKMALIRVEEICPFPVEELQQILSKYTQAKRYAWCQEEPENMGAYSWILPRLQRIQKGWEYVGRPSAAAPAVGYSKLHKQQLDSIYAQL